MRNRRQVLRVFFVVFVLLVDVCAELSSGRIKGKDEPQLVSWKVLEGITEPFGTNSENSIPVWKQMKASADQKAANMAMQQALHEYGQILRHPYVFGEMPSEERYDVFLSMAKLLKAMGFHQRAELILHEAMTHTTNAYEANFQLALLFLDKEDLETSKMYLKNCLFYQDSDLLILSYLIIILITENKIHEASFFLSRMIIGLEERVRKLSFILSENEIQSLQSSSIDYKLLTNWMEDTIVKIFSGEFRITPSATIDLLKYFSNLYKWIQLGEMNGRFLFDLGQSLYEGGRSKVGLFMMKHGYETSNIEEEGIVSHEIVKLRLAFEYPVMPESIVDIIVSYLNITTFLSQTSKNYTKIDLENIMDMYWPIPLLGWSGFPIMPVQRELLWRFSQSSLVRNDTWAKEWLEIQNHALIENLFGEWKNNIRKSSNAASGSNSLNTEFLHIHYTDSLDPEAVIDYDELVKDKKKRSSASKKHKTVVIPPSLGDKKSLQIEVGIFGGHLNNHPVGQMVLYNVIQQIKEDAIFGTPQNYKQQRHRTQHNSNTQPLIHLTLLSLPLVPDAVTQQIASKVDRIINVPVDTRQALKLLQELQFDVVLFPDWQPFPDQQSLVFQSLRIAPVQICFYVRGTSCANSAIDYYLLPRELEDYYLNSVPAAASNAIKRLNQTAPPNSGNAKGKVLARQLRPTWRELFLEQVLLVDNWPVLSSMAIDSYIGIIQLEHSANQNRKAQSGSGSSMSGASGTGFSSSVPDMTGSPTSFAIIEDYFSPNEYEGKIFFKDQPVAILPIYPTYIHPLMDDVIFKIMRAVPVLQILIVVSDSFFTHIRDSRHKLSWARKLVRRLWEKGGNLSHRIRLLPSTLSDYRMLQLIRQTDVVLDTFPFGSAPYFLGLALSVGTPVITLQSGCSLSTSKDDMNAVKQHLQHAFTYNGLYKDHPLRMLINSQFDIPWISSISNIAGFYQRVGLNHALVANSTADYFNLALKLLSDREYAYELRVKLLDSLDFDANQDNLEVGVKGKYSDTIKSPQTTQKNEVNGLGRVLYNLGIQWAYSRHYDVIKQQSKVQRNKFGEKSKTENGFEDFLKSTLGTIIH